MGNRLTRVANFASQILFSIVTPLLLVPPIARRRLTRSFVAFFFGRAYGSRYDSMIDSIGDVYGAPMGRGLAKAARLAEDVSVVVDCGTGTGFVTRQAAKMFPQATFIAFDVLPDMLRQARENCKELAAPVFHVQADSFALPLPDQSVDLLLVQNTMPCFSEFARVCRPGGIVLYVDTAAGWITGLARRLVERHELFEQVRGERVELGFYVLARKAGSAGDMTSRSSEIKSGQEQLEDLLCCPRDRSALSIGQDRLICQKGHCFPIHDGFPLMIPE